MTRWQSSLARFAAAARGAAAATGPAAPSFVGEVHSGATIDQTVPIDVSGLGTTSATVMLALVVASGVGVDLSTETAWKPLGAAIESGGDLTARLYWARGGEPLVDTFEVVDNNAAGTRLCGAVVGFSGADTVSPIGDSDGQATASGTSHASPEITPAAANSLLVYLAAIDADAAATWTEPAGMAERVDFSTAALFLTVGIADVAQAGTDAVSKTGTSSASKPGVAYLVALTPEGA